MQRVGAVVLIITLGALRAASAQQAPTASSPTPGQPVPPIRVSDTVKPPTKVKHVAPVYPREAQQARIQGVVIIETVIGVDGTVTDARVLRSIPQLDQAALDAVRQWEFTPTMINGARVPIVMTVTVNFSLANSSTQSPDGTVLLATERRPDGSFLLYAINAVRAGALAPWSPEEDGTEAIASVIERARVALAAREPAAANAVFEGLMLRRAPQPPSSTSIWFYQVSFSLARATSSREPFTVVILSDGSTVEPTTGPAPGVLPGLQPGAVR